MPLLAAAMLSRGIVVSMTGIMMSIVITICCDGVRMMPMATGMPDIRILGFSTLNGLAGTTGVRVMPATPEQHVRREGNQCQQCNEFSIHVNRDLWSTNAALCHEARMTRLIDAVKVDYTMECGISFNSKSQSASPQSVDRPMQMQAREYLR